MEGDERPELAALRKQNEELARQVREHEAIGALRRELRGCETVEAIAECGMSFARATLGARACAVLVDDAGEWVPVGHEVPSLRVAQHEALLGRLAEGPFVAHAAEDAELVSALRELLPAAAEHELFITPLPDDNGPTPALMITTGLEPGAALDAFCAELAFSVAGAVKNRARTEELAMLAVQERELVGLLREVEQRDAEMRADLEQAREFQNLMLGALPDRPGMHLEAMYEPLGLVGGDLYAVSDLGDRLRIFIADATGHGVRASLTTMFIKNGYDAVKLTAPDPATLLELLNDSIARTYRTAEMLFTAACLDLEIATGKVSIACAANPPSCIVRKDGMTMFEGGGALMGLRPGMRYASTSAQLEPGDGIYLFTDGIADTHSEKGELFGEDRLFATIRTAHDGAGRATDAVRAAIKAFCGSRGLTDDATMIGLVYAGPEAPEDPLTARR